MLLSPRLKTAVVAIACGTHTLAQPSNDNCSGAIALTGGTVQFSLDGASSSRDAFCVQDEQNHVWFKWTNGDCEKRTVAFDTFGTAQLRNGFNSVLGVTFTCSDDDFVDCNDNFAANVSDSQVRVVVPAGETVFLRVARVGTRGTEGQITAPPAIADDQDNDGITDCQDPCPTINNNLDSDLDTVPDCFDDCPDHPNATVISGSAMAFFPTIRRALDTAKFGDVIELGPCVFDESGFNLSNRGLTIRGDQQAGRPLINGAGLPGFIFRLEDSDDTTRLEHLEIRNAVFGAVDTQNSNLVLQDVVFENNTPVSGVGGVNANAGTLTIDRCVFRNNNADIRTFITVLSVTNSLFVAGPDSGVRAMSVRRANSGPENYIANNTFVGRDPSQTYIFVQDSGAPVDIHNCVFDGHRGNVNFARAFTGPVTTSRNVMRGATGDDIDGVPIFVDPAAGNYRLDPGSPGIDAADADVYLAAGGGPLDLSGAARSNNDAGTPDTGSGAFAFLDAGAFEYQENTPTPNTADYNDDLLIDIFDVTDLLQAIADFSMPGAGQANP